MIAPALRQLAGHELVEHRSANTYRPYDRLVFRDPKGRTILREGWAKPVVDSARNPQS
jgi:hypothetical protein